MESELWDVLQYCFGFSRPFDYLDMATEFYDLGKIIRGENSTNFFDYEGLLSIVYETIDCASDVGNVNNVKIKLHGIEHSPYGVIGPDDVAEKRLYSIEAIDREGETIYYSNFELYAKPEFDFDRFHSFIISLSKEALSAHWRPLPIDTFTLYSFIKYAFLMGGGMPVKEAIMNRLHEVQREHSYLQ